MMLLPLLVIVGGIRLVASAEPEQRVVLVLVFVCVPSLVMLRAARSMARDVKAMNARYAEDHAGRARETFGRRPQE